MMPKELCMEAHNIVFEAVTKTIPKKKEMQEGKVVAPGVFTSSCKKKRNERQEIKGKIYSSECRVPENSKQKQAFLNGKCRETEENNGMCVLSHSVMSNSATPWIVAHRAPLGMEFPRQEYWSGLPFPSPGDLPDPGTEPPSFVSTALAGRFFTTMPPGSPKQQNRKD